MKLSNQSIIITLLIQISSLSIAMENKRPVFAFQQADVISINKRNLGTIGDISSLVAEALPKAGTLIKNHPSWLIYAKPIAELAIKIAKTDDETKKGMGNLVDELDKQLQEKNYGILSQEEKEIIMGFAVTPTPNEQVIKTLATIKAGYKIFTTNSDAREYGLYESIMKNQHKVDIAELFDKVMVTPHYPALPAKKTAATHHKLNDKIVISLKRSASPIYFQNIRATADMIESGNPIYYVAKDKDEYFKALESQKDLLNITPVKYTNDAALNDYVQEKLADFTNDFIKQNDLD